MQNVQVWKSNSRHFKPVQIWTSIYHTNPHRGELGWLVSKLLISRRVSSSGNVIHWCSINVQIIYLIGRCGRACVRVRVLFKVTHPGWTRHCLCMFARVCVCACVEGGRWVGDLISRVWGEHHVTCLFECILPSRWKTTGVRLVVAWRGDKMYMVSVWVRSGCERTTKSMWTL